MPLSNGRPLLQGLPSLVCLLGASSTPQATTTSSAPPTASTFVADGWPPSSLGSIDNGVCRLALRASACAITSGAIGLARTLTVIDYSRPSCRATLSRTPSDPSRM
jgi:hypothetical protein